MYKKSGQMKTPPQQATGYQKEDDPEPTRSKLRGIAPKEIDYVLFDDDDFHFWRHGSSR